MSDNSYTPPEIWTWDSESGGKFANINRPISGATHDAELPRGKHPLQLYSLATPNGVKVNIMLEELVALGIDDAEYDAYTINILEGQQFGNEFVAINPNSKIPALLDCSVEPPQPVFESASIMLYLAEKFGHFIPTDVRARTECMSWLFWQMGATPFLGGGFGHFYAYAPEKYEYPINRFAMEVKRQLDLLDKHLAERQYICGDDYTIADMAIYPWYGELVTGELYQAQTFLQVNDYSNLKRWATLIESRETVQRAKRVNRAWGDEETQMLERHSAADFE